MTKKHERDTNVLSFLKQKEIEKHLNNQDLEAKWQHFRSRSSFSLNPKKQTRKQKQKYCQEPSKYASSNKKIPFGLQNSGRTKLRETLLPE